MVLTVRKALPATSELGTPTPKVFSMLTTSSSASIESRPSPLGPNNGRSLAISSGVVCSIKFLTSICLMRLRRSDSDIKEAPKLSQAATNVNHALPSQRAMRPRQSPLHRLYLIAGRSCLIRVRSNVAGGGWKRILRHGRLRGCRGFHFGLTCFVQLVTKFVLCFLEFLNGLTHASR